jgi:hypothetical protein
MILMMMMMMQFTCVCSTATNGTTMHPLAMIRIIATMTPIEIQTNFQFVPGMTLTL